MGCNMARNRNSDIAGKPFDKTMVGKVWDKGYRLEAFDTDIWRYDKCGRPMRFLDYGKTDSEFGSYQSGSTGRQRRSFQPSAVAVAK